MKNMAVMFYFVAPVLLLKLSSHLVEKQELG